MKKTYLAIFLISLTLIPLELIWTRILSAEFFYTFAFLVLSLAVLGLGLGGLVIRLWRSAGNPRRCGIYLSLAALCATFGPPLVFLIAPDFSKLFTGWTTIWKLALTVIILMSTYLFAGMALSQLFKQNHEQMPRLYMADLLGAGLGVLAAIWGMNQFGTPQASFLVALPILMASFLIVSKWERLLPLGVALLVLLLAPAATRWLELPREERAPVVYRHWDALSKIKVYEYDPNARGINIDNVANSPIYRFDGNWQDTSLASSEWGIDVSYLVKQFHPCTFLSLGAGGGGDVLQALVEGAAEVHAVEINGHINRLMLSEDTSGYTRPPQAPADSAAPAKTEAPSPDSLRPLLSGAEFSGHIYSDPRVKVVTEDARTYVRRFHNKFDVIYSLSSNTWAALASGSFALAENYLFTAEAFMDYWRAMSDSGYMMLEHQMYVPRLVSEVQDALGRMGVAHPTEHFAVYDLPQMRRKIILLSRRPLTDSLRYYALGPLTAEKFSRIHLIYPPANDSIAGTLIPRIIARGWRHMQDSAAIDLSPVTDNRPFVAQLGLWRNFTAEKRAKVNPYAEFTGFPLSRLMLLTVLIIVLLIVLPANLLPYLRPGPKLRATPWLYFFCIGVGFMAVEVILIQQFALMLGSSLYSVSTVLLTLLIASGIGSRFAAAISEHVAFRSIAIWLLLDVLLFGLVSSGLGGAGLLVRVLVAAVMIFPVGFFMGVPFPKGTLRVGPLIDWGFAVNGAASVLGSVVVLMLALSFGFASALLFAAVIYLCAYALYCARPAWE